MSKDLAGQIDSLNLELINIDKAKGGTAGNEANDKLGEAFAMAGQFCATHQVRLSSVNGPFVNQGNGVDLFTNPAVLSLHLKTE